MSRSGPADPGNFHKVPLEIGQELEGDDNMDKVEEETEEEDEDS